MTSRISEFELGWLSGLLEGEAYFGFPLCIRLKMVDEDIILRALVLFQRITGKQLEVKYKKVYSDNHSQTCEVSIYGDNAAKVMRTVVKYMSARRRKRIWQALNGRRVEKNKINLSNVVLNLLTRSGKQIEATPAAQGHKPQLDRTSGTLASPRHHGPATEAQLPSRIRRRA